MAYTYELKHLIKRVEKTRPERLARRKEGWEFPRMSLAEKENRLKMFHPSYKEESLRELRIGPSKGYSVFHRRSARYWNRGAVIDPDQMDLSQDFF